MFAIPIVLNALLTDTKSIKTQQEQARESTSIEKLFLSDDAPPHYEKPWQEMVVNDKATPELFDGLKYKQLLMCIAKYESSWRIDAVGDGGRAYGLLQFHKPTWEQYCEGDIENPRHQLECADKMLQENFNNIRHWTTRKFCIR